MTSGQNQAGPEEQVEVSLRSQALREALEALSDRAHAAYRSLVWEDPGFVPFFRAFTPATDFHRRAS